MCTIRRHLVTSHVSRAREFGLYWLEREGRIQSAERAVPTHSRSESRTFFQPDRADSRHAMKGDSYVPQPAGGVPSPAAPEPRTVQETRQGSREGVSLGQSRRDSRLGAPLD